ncbi:hypothetical protein Dip510_001610 [Elusimicrobium posterum]|uniref:hypothetical protein n=1 Tax=Elusimicrobium posterum TaxID=3116653 RepID=UPI003C77F263
MEEMEIRKIFNEITEGKRPYITDEELASNFPFMGCNAKRIRFHANHNGLKASGRVKKAMAFCFKEVVGAIEWKKNRMKLGK